MLPTWSSWSTWSDHHVGVDCYCTSVFLCDVLLCSLACLACYLGWTTSSSPSTLLPTTAPHTEEHKVHHKVHRCCSAPSVLLGCTVLPIAPRRRGEFLRGHSRSGSAPIAFWEP